MSAPPGRPTSGLGSGDLLAFPLTDGGWGACLVLARLEGDRLDVLSLAWTGDEPPSERELASAEPLFLTHHAWGSRPHRPPERLQVGDEPPPAGWIRAGKRAVPDLPPSPPSGGGWAHIAFQIGLQRHWDVHLPRDARDAYRDAERHRQDELEFGLGGPTARLKRGAWRLSIGPGSELVPPEEGPTNWLALGPMGALGEITYAGGDPGLESWLATRPLVEKLSWRHHGRGRIDLSKAHLRELHLEDLAVTTTIRLPPSARTLSLRGPLHVDLTVEAHRHGRDLTLDRHAPGGPLTFIEGLPQLTRLEIWRAGNVEADTIARYRHLDVLVVREASGALVDAPRLGELRDLSTIELYDVYGFDFESFPDASGWPALQSVTIHGYRKSQEPRLREKLRGVRHLALSGAKTDAWLAANFENPFRDWIDDAPAKGKAAVGAWKKSRTEISKATSAAAKKTVLRSFVYAFNDLDAAYGLDTVDREEVLEAFATLAEAAGVGDEVDSLFDAWRAF